MPKEPASITESVVELAALDWLRGLGYEVLSALGIAPGEPAAERVDYKQVFLFDRLQTKLGDLNPKIPLQGFAGSDPGAAEAAVRAGSVWRLEYEAAHGRQQL
jgi:hypothetical protein